MNNPVIIAYRVLTTATDEGGRRLKVESFDRNYAVKRAEELRARDPRARVVGIPVSR